MVDGLKTTIKIVWRVLLGLLLTVYVAVAALNYSVVQSYVGSAVGHWFSSQWGGTVRIGSLHATPWSHLIADNLLLVAPDGDTILDAKHLSARFERFPFRLGSGSDAGSLTFRRVYLRDAYYHLKITHDESTGHEVINLQYIIDYFDDGRPYVHHDTVPKFTVDVGTLALNRVHYKMDLPEYGGYDYDHDGHGVVIPHMEFFDINARFKNVHVVNEDVTARIVKMSTRERSGFTVENISGQVHVGCHDITVRDLDVETPHSHIMADATMEYPGWMPHYVHTVHHDLLLKEGTTVAMSDVAYWAPVLWGIDMQLTAEGTASGTIDALHTDGLHIGYGRATRLTVSGGVTGLPDIENTVFDVEHVGLRTEEVDLRRMGTEIPQLGKSLVKLLRKTEYVDLTASLHGGWNGRATANIDLACGLGNLRADLLTDVQPDGRRSVALEAGSDGMGLAWLGSDWLTHAGMALSVDAKLPPNLKNTKAIYANAELSVPSATVRGHRLSAIDASYNLNAGVVTLKAMAADSLLAFDAEALADLGDSMRSYAAEVHVDRLAAATLGLLPEQFADVSGHLIVKAQGHVLDDMDMELTANNLILGEMQVKDLRLAVAADGRHKNIRLESTPLAVSAYGDFVYADMPLMVRQLAAAVLPADLQLVTMPDSAELAAIDGNSLTFTAQLTGDGKALPFLPSGINVARGTRVSGSYSSGEMLKMVVRSDSLRLGGLLLNDIGLSSRMVGDDYVVDMEVQRMDMGTVKLMTALNVALRSNSSRMLAGLVWGGDDVSTQGDVQLQLQQGEVTVTRPGFRIGSEPWTLTIDSLNIAHHNGFDFKGKGIALQSGDQRISVGLSLLHRDNDCVALDFERFGLAGVCQILLPQPGLIVEGRANGHFELYGLGQMPYFNANLRLDSCGLNGQSLGNVAVRSNWNAELGTLNLQLASRQLDAHGWIGLDGTSHDISFVADIDSLDLSLAAPLVKDFSSRLEGLLHGSFDISGTTDAPIVLGEAMVQGGVLKLDMTGVTYYFDDSIRFNGNTVNLNRFKLRDTRGDTAYIDGSLLVRSLNNVAVNLDVQTDNLLLLDLPDGDAFYGTLLASASGHVGGELDNLRVEVDARTNEGSTLSVPVSDQRQVKSQNYISFVGDRAEAASAKAVKKKSASNIDLDVDLIVTPDVRLIIPMSFSGVSVNVGASGSGELHMSLDQGRQPQVIGGYEITSGNTAVTLMSLLVKNFSIEPGSNLTFQGSVSDARFDIRAVYSQRVNLSTLTGSLSVIDNTQKYIQVENVIAVSGTLNSPTIGFDLRLPSADKSVEDEVFSYIDRSSERDMLNQTVSLLASGSFYNVSGTDQGGSAASSGLSTIASTLGGMMADMVNVVDINVDYRAATDMTNQQLDLNISKDWGRWYIESTLGYGGESRELEASSTGGTVIDALVGYRLSPLVHLFAYNRTNTNDYTRMDLPYKQGIGLKLTKDFDRWTDLLPSGKRKAKKKK